MSEQTVNDTIYIQLFEDDIDLREHHEVTWCNEKMNDSDIKYVLATKLTRHEEALKWIAQADINYANAEDLQDYAKEALEKADERS